MVVVAAAVAASGLPAASGVPPPISTCGPSPSDCLAYTCLNGTWTPTGKKQAAGTVCNDFSACTTGDKCDSAGNCIGTPLVGINDGNACTTDSCNVVTGAITHTAITSACCSNGTAKPGICCTSGVPLTNACCSSGTPLTAACCTSGTPLTAACCTSGTPLSTACCTSGTPLTSACCSAGVIAVGRACNDSNLCTYGDACNASAQCVGTPITCTPSGSCQTSTCNGTSICSVAIKPASTVCRASGGACDNNVCDGTSAQCPSTSSVLSLGTVCRTSRGACDNNFCNGTTAICPAGVLSSGQVCPNSTDPCDAVCDGTSTYCQPF
jgi:hypothetical protein